MNTTTEVMKINWFYRLWQGEERLIKAFYEAHLFWLLIFTIYYIFLQPKILVRLPITLEQALTYVMIPSLIIINIYNLFSLVAIWRCAFNVQNKAWGFIARIYALIILSFLIEKFIGNLTS